MKISAYIITKNEEKRLPATLKALNKVADEIIVVDSGSKDKTLEIAKSFGAKVFFKEWVSYSNQKNYAQNQCQYDWLLSLDADEVLSQDLIQEILTLKNQEPCFKVYRLKIADMYPGFKRPRPFARKYNLIRFYHKDFATQKENLLSEDRISLTKKTPIGDFKNLVWHYSYLSLFQQVNKLNFYTNAALEVALKKHKTYSIFRLITEFPRQFFVYYILKRQFMNGMWGFIFSVNMAHARFLKIAKYFEYQALKK